jgi:hypothetical protein
VVGRVVVSVEVDAVVYDSGDRNIGRSPGSLVG